MIIKFNDSPVGATKKRGQIACKSGLSFFIYTQILMGIEHVPRSLMIAWSLDNCLPEVKAIIVNGYDLRKTLYGDTTKKTWTPKDIQVTLHFLQ